jgi:hypothetical protein
MRVQPRDDRVSHPLHGARRSTESAWSRATESTTERSARMSSRISMRSSRCVIPITPGSSPLIWLG